MAILLYCLQSSFQQMERRIEMKRKTVIVVILMVVVYFSTVNAFGLRELFNFGVTSIIREEFSSDYRNTNDNTLIIGVLHNSTFVHDFSPPKEYRGLRVIKSWDQFQSDTLEYPHAYFVVVSVNDAGVQYGVASVQVNVMEGPTPVYSNRRTMLWTFFRWVEVSSVN